jgi:TamB, inner membrane protein subunit of TAM complex
VRLALAEQELPVGGSIDVDLTDTVQVSGQVDLKPGGRLLVLGRVFEVNNGAIRFNPRDVSNPDIRLSLSGRGLDGTPLYVTVAGTWNEPITDPPQAQLQEMLGGGTASAVSGGMQALGLGALFGSSFQLRVSGADPGESVPSYSAAVRLNEDLWFEANYQKEGDSLSQKDNGVLSGTLDYRFQDNWSLRTKVGTTSGSLDLSWQHRY